MPEGAFRRGTSLAALVGMVTRRILVLVAMLVVLGGCALSTRTARMGPLPMGPLVTLVVSDDRAVVARECQEVQAPGPVLGCSMWHTVQLEDRTEVKVMKVVRYTDAVPSALTLEIDAHELCHVVAALQPIIDPCHVGNGGVVRSSGVNISGMSR